jgi:hypothetical protein
VVGFGGRGAGARWTMCVSNLHLQRSLFRKIEKVGMDTGFFFFFSAFTPS